MSTHLGWPVVVMPSTPPAPASIDVILVDPVAMSVSPFTGQQQTQVWAPGWREFMVSLPPLNDTEAQPWINWLVALNGVQGVFQFTAAFTAAYPLTVPTGKYYRLKANRRKYTINPNRYYGLQFEVMEAF